MKQSPFSSVEETMMQGKAVILFDGVCNLCNASINFVIDRDSGAYFTFGALQSSGAAELLSEHDLPESYLDSIILVEDNVEGSKVYVASDAALRIARRLPGMWRFLYHLRWIPRFIRDGVYNWIAQNRYRWFGRQDTCRVPTPELRARFLS
jgi:predicted DCC family thiol-disulfide oxidoreductase YuxK